MRLHEAFSPSGGSGRRSPLRTQLAQSELHGKDRSPASWASGWPRPSEPQPVLPPGVFQLLALVFAFRARSLGLTELGHLLLALRCGTLIGVGCKPLLAFESEPFLRLRGAQRGTL